MFKVAKNSLKTISYLICDWLRGISSISLITQIFERRQHVLFNKSNTVFHTRKCLPMLANKVTFTLIKCQMKVTHVLSSKKSILKFLLPYLRMAMENSFNIFENTNISKKTIHDCEKFQHSTSHQEHAFSYQQVK